ncbi:MAG: hypothetical protein KH195_13560 [Clostridiaceae bacterium]|nr:hypothetical protein [Clostridiaceae bacterium]
MSPNERISLFLDRVCAHLLWPPYRARVRRELTDHLLTRVEYLQNDRGFNEAEAVELAVRMLGDPDALGRSLRHARFPPRYLCCLIVRCGVWCRRGRVCPSWRALGRLGRRVCRC